MIGVLTDGRNNAVAAELFELFKTPWEFFHPGRPYDVLLVVGREVPEAVTAKLLIIYGSEELECDRALGLVVRADDCNSGRLCGKRPG